MVEQIYDPNWVELHEYTQLWSAEFNQEKMVLLDALCKTALDIQHVGSTSVAGLASKPIIDILVGVHDMDDISAQDIGKLEAAHYVFRGDAGVQGRLFFRKGHPRAKYHLSIATLNDNYWKKQIIFRDYLRTHPKDVEEYQELKVKLARLYSNDRGTYTALKNPLITDILGKAFSWRNGSYSD